MSKTSVKQYSMPPKRGSTKQQYKKKIVVNGNEQINAVATKVTDDINQMIDGSENGSDFAFPSQETPRGGEGLETADDNGSSYGRMNDSIVSGRGDMKSELDEDEERKSEEPRITSKSFSHDDGKEEVKTNIPSLNFDTILGHLKSEEPIQVS